MNTLIEIRKWSNKKLENEFQKLDKVFDELEWEEYLSHPQYEYYNDMLEVLYERDEGRH